MNLYYEDVPATEDEAVQLPPLLRAEALPEGSDVLAKAIVRAATGEAGLVCYSQSRHVVDMAIALAPEVPRAQAMQMQQVMMVALGDSIGALAPPEVGVRYRYPGDVLLNRGHAGLVRLAAAPAPSDTAESEEASIPDWLVVSVQLRLAFGEAAEGGLPNADYYMANTSLAEEGGGFISRTRLVESVSRHFLVWLNRWQDEGFQPIHAAWMARYDEDKSLSLKDGRRGEFLGLDEHGGGLVTIDGQATTIPAHEQARHFTITPLHEGAPLHEGGAV